ncbi:hypothetical protein [Streptomyces sp. NPDC056061]|uniref:hypothetical protein n=1 Tax=Streptomyces sp. NPDC056061 TaxID=3345700 RepID=UPI0035E1F9D9
MLPGQMSLDIAGVPTYKVGEEIRYTTHGRRLVISGRVQIVTSDVVYFTCLFGAPHSCKGCHANYGSNGAVMHGVSVGSANLRHA